MMPEKRTFFIAPKKMIGDKKLKMSEIHVYLAICSHGEDSFPSVKRIAAMVGYSGRTVHRAIKRLEQMNYVKLISGAQRGRSNVYKPIFEKIEGGMTPKMSYPPMTPMMSEGCDTQGVIGVCHPRCHTEEKREENIEEKRSQSNPSPHTALPGDEEDPIVMTFPTKEKNSEYRLRQSAFENWQERFPRIDVLEDFYRAREWIEANPSKRKTEKGMPSFLTRWLNNDKAHHPPRAQQCDSGELEMPRQKINREEWNEIWEEIDVSRREIEQASINQ